MKGYCKCGKVIDETEATQFEGVCEECFHKGRIEDINFDKMRKGEDNFNFDDRIVYKVYPNGYKREHSCNLKSFFNIDPNGVDYYNPNNVAIEFKETFAICNKSHWFKVPKKQVDVSDLFVFCLKRERYWVVDKEEIKGAYKFNTYHNRANIRLGKVKTISIFETSSLAELKTFLDSVKL